MLLYFGPKAGPGGDINSLNYPPPLKCASDDYDSYILYTALELIVYILWANVTQS